MVVTRRAARLAVAATVGLTACNSSKSSTVAPTPPSATCTYSTSPATHTFSPAGGTTTVGVTSAPQCAWTVVSTAAWLSAVPASGTGTATIEVRAESNTSAAARSAALQVAGNTLEIRQDGRPACGYAVAPAGLSFGAEGGEGRISVAGEPGCPWSARTDATWITIVGADHGEGDGSIVFQVAPHSGADPRDGAVMVGNVRVNVRQSGRVDCAVTLAYDSQSFDATGGTGHVDVAAPQECRWTARSDTSWIRITVPPGGEGTGSARVEFVVDPNAAQSDRLATIMVGTKPFMVRQLGSRSCTYQVAPVAFTLHWHHTGGQFDIATQPGCSWTASKDAAWLGLGGAPNGDDSATITFAVDIFTEETSRNAPIMVRWPTPTAGQNVWITQEGCRYALSATVMNFAAAGGSGQVFVFGDPFSPICSLGCPWTAVATAPWIQITSGSPGSGDNPFHFSVAPNPGPGARTGSIVVANRTLLVTQSQP